MFDVLQEASDFVLRTFIRHMGERACLNPTLEGIKVGVEIIFRRQKLDQSRNVILSRPKRGEGVRRGELKGKDVSTTRDSVG